MEDFKQKGMKYYSLHKGGINWISVGQNNHAKSSMAEFTLSENFSMQHEWHKLPGFMQKPLDLQLSADEFISRSADDFLGKGVLGGFFNSRITTPDEVLDLDDLKLSLSIGGNASRKGGFSRSRIGKKTSAPSSEIIDLEDPNLVFSDNTHLMWTPGLATKTISYRDKHMLGRVSQARMRGNSSGTLLTESEPHIRPSCQKLTSSDSGFRGYSREFSYADLLSKNQTSRVHVRDNLDLNMVKPEDSCCTIDHSMPLYPSSSSFYRANPTSWKANVNHCPETQDKPQLLDLNVDLAVTYQDKISFIDIDSDPGEDFWGIKPNQKVESVGSLSKPSNGHSCDTSTVRPESNTERDAESLTVAHSSQNCKADDDLNCHKLRSSSESDCIEHQSSSVKTMQSGVKCGDLNFCIPDKSQMAKMTHSGDQDQRSSDSSNSNIQIIRQEPDVDELVQNAAELLIRMSLQSHEVPSKEFEPEEFCQPQCSSDSYVEMVLKAKESDPDDYFVASNAYAVDISEKKENMYKLKRGTRMKDFQKDILPGLSVLSRHEICEDVNILEGVIRSREYKKMRAKFVDGSNCSRQTRSKRSRARYSRR